MAATTKYTVTINGKKATRSSHRPYTHAVIGQADKIADRDRAFNYKADKTDESNFRYHSKIAGAVPGVPVDWSYVNYGRRIESFRVHTAEEIADSKELVGGGFEGYVAHLRQDAIAWFETRRSKGHYDLGALGWSMSEANAQKMASQKRNSGYVNVRVVPVGAVVEG